MYTQQGVNDLIRPLKDISSMHTDLVIAWKHETVYEKIVNLFSEIVEITLHRKPCKIPRMLISLHFTVHIVDGTDGQQVHLPDLYSQLHRP